MMRELRVSIAVIVSLLVFIGVVMIYSSSGIYALQELGDDLYFLKRHLMFLCLGIVLMGGVMVMDYRDLRKLAKPMMIIALVLLVAVLVPFIGREINGARRWFKFGPFLLQPSEFAKLAVLIYVSDFLARKQNRVAHFWKGFVPVMGITGLTAALILKQPDLGTTLLIFTISLMLLFVAGGRLEHIGALALMVIPAFYFLIARVPYRWTRIVTFLDPWRDSQGSGFQLVQSQIALGSGGLFGVGLGKSMQKLFYLPAAHTDFILSIVGEELGFVGAFTIIILFSAFIWQGARIVKRTNDPFGYFLSLGIVAMIGLQAVVNVGVSIGALPTKGLPLPFVSYGGSALVVNLMAVGLLLNISRINDLSSHQ